MAEGNHFCETENCMDLAMAFGLKGTLKKRTCSSHVAILISKGMTIYTIDGYHFISTPQDGLLYNERKAAIEHGLGNLAVHETNIDAEFAAALQLLESEKEKIIRTIEERFAEIHSAVTKRYNEMKQEFASLAENFNQYIKYRESILVPNAELLCSAVKTASSFIQLEIADISTPATHLINQLWSVSATDLESLLKKAAEIEADEVFNEKGDSRIRPLMESEVDDAALQKLYIIQHNPNTFKPTRLIQRFSANACVCGRTIVDGKFFCANKCFCSFCLLKHIVITGDRRCSRCLVTIEGITLWSVKCSDCMEAIAVNRSEPKKLTGVCGNGCILCRRCVIIEEQKLVCPVCGAAVQGEDVQTILLEQKQCLLACRCIEPQGKLKPAECGHDLHVKCDYMTFSCRVCRQLLKPRPETLNINQFV